MRTMKTSLLYILLVGAIVSPFTLKAGYGTNSFFVTVTGLGLTPENLEAARTSIECQPAENDLAGNWGAVTEGYQLSLRVNKESFYTNEPVLVTIIFRNASTNFLPYAEPSGSDLDFSILVADQNGRQLPDAADVDRTTGHSVRFIPGTQHKFQLDLRKRFEFSKPGVYSVTVRRKIPQQNGVGWTEVNSKPAKIMVLHSLKLQTNSPSLKQ